MKVISAIFEDREIRRLYDEKTETWFFPSWTSSKFSPNSLIIRRLESIGTS
jgi:catabolite regulation protein CreA